MQVIKPQRNFISKLYVNKLLKSSVLVQYTIMQPPALKDESELKESLHMLLPENDLLELAEDDDFSDQF